jgi:hypothetical protein
MTTTEMPKYRVTREIQAAEKSRFRLERPFTEQSDPDRWQYGERTFKPGEIIETREWPHPSFFPLNDVAKRVRDYFGTRQKSRLQRSPYDASGRLNLDDGLTNPLPKIGLPKLPSVDLRPAS